MAAETQGEQFSPPKIRLHIEYETLRVEPVARMLGAIDRINSLVYASALNLSFSDFLRVDMTGARYAHEISETISAQYPEAKLRVDTVHTGESITFKFKNGWLPTIRPKGEDIEVGLPQGLAVPMVVVGLLFGAATRSANSAKETGEAVKVWREAKKVQLENRKLELEIEELQRRLNAIPPPLQKQLDQDLSEFGRAANNPGIRNVDIDLEPGTGQPVSGILY